jgi:dolichol-phosphate mannosyltransferase
VNSIASESRRFRLVIPAKDEAQRIGPPVDALCRYFGDRARIMVVANGCTDGTADIVRTLQQTHKNLDLLVADDPIGKGGAVRAGMRCGREEFVGFVDADGSYTAEQVDRLYQRCREDGISAAIGSRRLPGARVGKLPPLGRRIASLTYRSIVRALFSLRYTDLQCGVKIFRRSAIDSILDDLELANFAFDVDLLLALDRKGFRVVEEPVSWDDVGGSTIDLLSAGLSMLASILRLRLRRGMFRHIPFTARLASSWVIAPRSGFRVLLLAPPRTLPGLDDVDDLREHLQRAGHQVDVARPNGPLEELTFVTRYAIGGHAKVDAICDFGNTRVGRILEASTKPAFLARVSQDVERIAIFRPKGSHGPTAETLLTGLGDAIARRHGYRGAFRNIGGQWALVAASSRETLLEVPQSLNTAPSGR